MRGCTGYKYSTSLVYDPAGLSSVYRWCSRRWILSSHSHGRGITLLFQVRNCAACVKNTASLHLIDESFHFSLTSTSPVTFTPSQPPTTWWLQPSTLACSTSPHNLTRWELFSSGRYRNRLFAHKTNGFRLLSLSLYASTGSV